MKLARRELIAPKSRETTHAAAHQLLRYSPALLLLVIAVADSARYADPDLWWHLLIGQSILRTGHLPFADSYSYSISGHFWRDGEWLSETLMAVFYNGLGVFGLKLMKFLCMSGTLALLTVAAAETYAPVRLQFWLLLISAALWIPFSQFRPQLFTYLLLSTLLMLLARHNYRGHTRMLWLAVPIMALWANLHGGFVVGVAVMCTYAGAFLLTDLIQHRGWRHALGVCAVAAASTFATLLTPYGLGSWYEAAQSILNPVLHTTMLEWKPLLVAMRAEWMVSSGFIIFYIGSLALMAGLAITVILTPREGDWPLVAVAAVLITAAFISVRNIPLAILGVFVPLVHHSAACFARSQRDAFASPRMSALLRNQPILVVLAVTILAGTGFFSNRLAASSPYPEKAVNFMQQHSLSGNTLNDIDWGGYLMWHFERESRLFIDNRYTAAFPTDLILQYLHFLLAKPGWREVLDNYPNDYVLIGVKRPAYALMLRQKNWSLIYRDQDAALFARSGSPATKIPGVPVVTTASHDRAFP